MQLNRSEILSPATRKSTTKNEEKSLTFMINRNDFMARKIKQFVRDCQPDIDRLLGRTKVMVAERKNCNIGSAIFAKSSFSKEDSLTKTDQKCAGRACKTCQIMTLNKTFTVWKNNVNLKRDIKLDMRSDCQTECVIYIYVCNICKDNDSFYVGQSVNSCRTRANGHRACFTNKLYKNLPSPTMYIMITETTWIENYPTTA